MLVLIWFSFSIILGFIMFFTLGEISNLLPSLIIVLSVLTSSTFILMTPLIHKIVALISKKRKFNKLLALNLTHTDESDEN